MSENKDNQVSRRQFMVAAGAVAGMTIAPGVILNTVSAKAADDAVSNKNRWGMLIDTTKCNDCSACVDACNDEHGLKSLGRPETDAQWIRKVTIKDKKTDFKRELPLMCQHCENPPCVDVCPTGASFKREDGIVLVDKHICIGCRYCMMACPYKARNFIHETLTEQLSVAPRGKGTVEACTMCVHRIDKDGAYAKTACQEACIKSGHNAITFGDLNDPNSNISQKIKEHGSTKIRADLGLNPAVSYQGI
jgi:molybdopterin-containing oxidoreductase family iron-sulfur binding subunit